MTTYKYTDSSNTVVHVIDDDGVSRSSMLASALPEGTEILPAELPDPQIAINEEARAYLNSTDWYVVRFAETGTPIPQDILDARQVARSRII